MHIFSPVLWQFLMKWLTHFAIFPEEASSVAGWTDGLYLYLVVISIVGLATVFLLLFGFATLFRKQRSPVATQIHGSTIIEATWTIIPLGLFLLAFVWGAILYFRIFTPPPNATNIYIVGKQWMWKAEHPGGQHEINALHIPVNQPVQLTMISQDVFHSFSIPAFRIKREVIPGRYTTVWFTATKQGTYHLFCTQYCGTLHSQMIGEIVAMDPADYQAWTATSTSGTSLAQNGERLFSSLGCNGCHSGLAGARGPNLGGDYGAKMQLATGQWVTIDEAFLREMILNPSQHLIAGYQPIMPTYQGQVSEDALIALVEYIKQLHTNYRNQQTLVTSESNTAYPNTSDGQMPAPSGLVKP
jgi:cytochrome c oxidase subunit II